MKRAICIGECMIELRRAGEGLLRQDFAGDAFNTAVYLKRSAPDLDVQFYTATGVDRLSQDMRAGWRSHGVGDGLAATIPDRVPGMYLIETDAAGDRTFHYWRGESAARDWLGALRRDSAIAKLDGADLIYLSGISLAILTPPEREAAIQILGELGGKPGLIAYDPNHRPQQWPSADVARDVFERMLRVADIVLPSRQDLGFFYATNDPTRQIDLLRDRGAKEIALTADADGCFVYDDALHHLPLAARAAVIDTSGAGDAFNGAYLAARLGDRSPVEAARRGLALAARVVSHPGAIMPLVDTHRG